MTCAIVAGATGLLGGCLVRELKARGYRVVATGRNPSKLAGLAEADERHAVDALRHPSRLIELCAGADIVFSCLGASVMPGLGHGWLPYTSVDTRANGHLIHAARSNGAKKFVYVGVACRENLNDLAYVQAHEQVATELRGSGLQYGIVRATGFFGAFVELVRMAAKGRVPLIGTGSAKTNPVHEGDVAKVCVDVAQQLPVERDVGGPELLTRREIVELAFTAVDRPPRHQRISPGVVAVMARMLRPIHPRMSQLTSFFAAISVRDVVAPAIGTRKLFDYFQEYAREHAHTRR